MRHTLASVAVLLSLSCVFPAAVGAAAPGTPADQARARRSALLVKAAELTDRLEDVQAGVVAAQLRQARAAGSLAQVRHRMRARAVSAYMNGAGATVAALGAPRAYLEVAAAKERRLIAGHRAAASEAGAQQRRAELLRGDLRQASAHLAEIQAELDTVIAADDARRAEEQRRADEARRAAVARQAAARGRARVGLPPGGTASPGGYAPSPLDPNALVTRHKVATERQLALMRRISFGPLAPGAPLPNGLRTTGGRVDGLASWYGPGFNGRPTASGAIYDQEAWTVASKELPLGTLLVVRRGDQRVLLLVNDRGPYVEGRVLDLSAAAARALGAGGVFPVSAEVVAAG
ncbi:MAG TPA: septal ring lytic transglycosylase RlpA family protein [Acidimicrobiales bacterium]|nr:septal ring lytic transglycosylase RlpA family protein [Acidimicrobiales bacterium]